jgi:hypothetical protein
VTKYSEFFNLLNKAGLFNSSYYTFPFLVEGEYYTVFIPTSQALKDYGAENLSKEELKEFLKYHFVSGELIFTDGSKPDGFYTTTHTDENADDHITRYSKVHIRPGPDVIEILDKNGKVYLKIPEQEDKTNTLVSYDSDEYSDSQWDYIIRGVAHSIDRVFVKDSLQVN